MSDPTNDYRVTIPPPCEGCGCPAHGSVNAYIDCLKRALESARDDHAPCLRLRAEVAETQRKFPGRHDRAR